MADRPSHAQDFTWAMSQVFIWSCVEPLIGIVCACLPTYGPLVRHWYTVSRSQVPRSKRTGQGESVGAAKGRLQSRGARNSAQLKGYWSCVQEPMDTTLREDDQEAALHMRPDLFKNGPERRVRGARRHGGRAASRKPGRDHHHRGVSLVKCWLKSGLEANRTRDFYVQDGASSP